MTCTARTPSRARNTVHSSRAEKRLTNWCTPSLSGSLRASGHRSGTCKVFRKIKDWRHLSSRTRTQATGKRTIIKRAGGDRLLDGYEVVQVGIIVAVSLTSTRSRVLARSSLPILNTPRTIECKIAGGGCCRPLFPWVKWLLRLLHEQSSVWFGRRTPLPCYGWH